MRKLIACIGLCGCASQGMPPGGPPDTEAPMVVSITPDTGRTMVKGGVAVFRFDEVVSERPTGATTLGDLFLVSPRQGVPNVSWHRSAVELKPRRGWLPNTTYTVTMLPGMTDLRGNVKNTGASTFFSTGPTVDNGVITGSVSDLMSGTSTADAIVEARAGTDTTVSWIARTDTTGAFRLAHLPRKAFTLRAYSDKNHNFGVDPGEPVDTAAVAAGDSTRVDFFVVRRDSIAPRLTDASMSDSVTMLATFDRPSDSASAVNPANYTLVASDSSRIAIVSVSPPPRDTTVKRRATTRSVPLAAVKIKISAPLAEKKTYKLRATGIRGLLGQTLPSEVTVAAVRAAPLIAPGNPKKPPTNPTGGVIKPPIKND